MTGADPVWGDVLAHVRDLALAYALALPIGWDREQAARSAGVRTFPLVAMANCAVVLVATQFGDMTPEVRARVLQGSVTGTVPGGRRRPHSGAGGA